MDTESIVFYLALLLLVGSVAEIYARAKGLGAVVTKDRKGNVIPYKRRLTGPILLALASVVLLAVIGSR